MRLLGCDHVAPDGVVAPLSRVHLRIERPPRPGAYVLYWMIAARRTRCNPALDRALHLCRELRLPLLVIEPLRVGYRWASDRHHRFLMDGMRDQARAFEAAGVRYLSWVEPEPGAGRGLLAALAEQAAVVVTDRWPGFFHPQMRDAAAAQLDVRFEEVDGVGLLPLAWSEKAYTTAASFRRHLQKRALDALAERSTVDPLASYDLGLAPVPDLARWPSATDVASLPIDHAVAPVETGGAEAAERFVERLFADRLDRYHEDRNHPDRNGATGLSPFLHYGQIGAEDLVHRILDHCRWEGPPNPKPTGSRGWWGLPPGAEALMDELVTWRELSQTFAFRRPDHDTYGSIPDWARKTLAEHADDPRHLVSFDRLEAAASPDPLWNAAQRQLVRTGRMHNYLRMLWGKLVLAWAPDPPTAFDWLLALNDKYASDGRDPNSTAGVAWVFGRHDRAWGPERPIYGKVRYMTSASTQRKLKLARYVEAFGS